MSFNADELLAEIEKREPKPLTVEEADALTRGLFSPAFLRLQKEIILTINGALNRLATIDLTKDGAMLDVARVQGTITGLRAFFDLATDLLNAAEPDRKRLK